MARLTSTTQDKRAPDPVGVVRQVASVARVVFAAGLLFAASVAAAADYRVVVVAHGAPPVPWWTVLKNGMDSAAAELGVDVEYLAPDSFDMAAMSALIAAAVATEPDGLVVTIPDADALAGAIRAAVASGVPVVSINSGSESFAALGIPVHVGQPEYDAGLAAGERMRTEGATSVVCLNQEGGNVAGRQRCDGFRDGFGGESDELTLSYDADEVAEAVSDYFVRNPRVDGALILGPTASAPAIGALRDAGLLVGVTVATFDFTPEVLDGIAARQIAFAVDQQPYLQGFLPIVLLKKYAEYGVLPTGVVRTGPSFISSSNVAQVIALSRNGIR